MKTKKLGCKPASIANKRWAAYAAAGAATTLVGTNSAEATIHYSGLLNVYFGGGIHYHFTSLAFPLDQPGDSFRLQHGVNSYHEGMDRFRINGIASAAFRGYQTLVFGTSLYVSKLPFGQRISAGSFVQTSPYSNGPIVVGHSHSNRDGGQWRSPGVGFIGFRFNNGAGLQYGWARIKINRRRGDRVPFELFDYAYADPGEPITAGQMSSDGQAADQGSLGWLALGAVGLLAWRSRAAR